MSENDEPLEITPTSRIGETPPILMATADQGKEMETIWQMMAMVTPTTSTNFQSLEKLWNEFMARFRRFELPLDESRA